MVSLCSLIRTHSSGHCRLERTLTYWHIQSRAGSLGIRFCEQRLKGPGIFILEILKFRDYRIAIFKYLKGHHIDHGADWFSFAPKERTQTSEFKSWEKWFNLNVRNYFLVQAVWQWNRLPWKVVNSSLLEVFRVWRALITGAAVVNLLQQLRLN